MAVTEKRPVIYTGGDILTMEEEETAEALLEEGGVIRAVGTLVEALALAPDAAVVDLAGHTLLPAFVDPHSHITAYAKTLSLLSLEQAENFDDIARAVAQYREEHRIAPGEWIIAFGYDHNRLAERAHPTRRVLDIAAPGNPVLISHKSGHMGVMNTAALHAAGITAETPNPEGGSIGREPAGYGQPNSYGQPNGYLEETAFTVLAASRIPKPSEEQLCRQLKTAQEAYLRHGITTVQDGLTKAEDWAVWKAAALREMLRLDVVCYVDEKENAALLQDNPDWRIYRKRLRIGGYKIFLDGSPQGRTAWLSEPYAPSGASPGEEPGYRGYPIYTDRQVEAFLRQAAGEGQQLLAHCNGDAAAEQWITAAEAVLGPSGGAALRPVMIHAQTVRADQLERMAKLSLIASLLVAHTHYWGDVHRANLGEERAARISPARTAMDCGVTVTFHQDTPVLPPDMLDTVWCAVNRRTQSGVLLGEGERITPLEALRAVTINAARQYFEEERKGSLRPGKLADLVILDRNPLAVPPMELRNIRVLETIKEGESLYRA